MVLALQVLWKEIQALQMKNELDYNSFDNLNRQHYSELGRDVQRATLSKNMRVTERKSSRLLAGASMYDDSDSSRGEDEFEIVEYCMVWCITTKFLNLMSIFLKNSN